MNFIDGVSNGSAIVLNDLSGTFSPPVKIPPEGTAVTLGVRPEHITIDPDGDTHTVDLTEALGGVSYVHLRSKSGDKIVVEERGEARSKIGAQVGMQFSNDQAMLFDAATEARIR